MKGDARKYVLTLELERSRGGEACSEMQERCFKDRSEAEESAEHFASLVKAQLVWILKNGETVSVRNSSLRQELTAAKAIFETKEQAHRTC